MSAERNRVALFTTRSRSAVRSATAFCVLCASFLLAGCSTLNGFVEDLLPLPASVHVLIPGECFDNPTTLPTSGDNVPVDLPRANCTLDHDNEVITSVPMLDENYPGDDETTIRSFTSCLPEFESFIGVGFDEAGTLEYGFFHPSEESWQLGDREILCFGFDTAAQTAYSLERAGAERLEAAESDGSGVDSTAEAGATKVSP